MNSKLRSRIIIGCGVYIFLTIVAQANSIQHLNRKIARQFGQIKAYKECFDLALNEMTPQQLASLRSKMETRRDFGQIISNF